MKKLICIVGPTASGKTKVAIELAKHYNTEIVNFDSRQFYKEMHIGTAKPSDHERAQAIHHFIDCRSIHQDYNAGEYERDASKFIMEAFKTKDHIICVGGSGFYLNALLFGFDEMPAIDPTIREKLNLQFKSEGIEPLQKMLKEKDPEHYAKMDIQNHARLIRALEICLSTQKTYSSFKTKSKNIERDWKAIIIGMDWNRDSLYKRIEQRVDQMMEDGLLNEVQNLYPKKDLNALKTVGYTEIFNHLNGSYDLPRAIELIKRNTRRYAKKQMTWFKNQIDTTWFAPEDIHSMMEFIDK